MFEFSQYLSLLVELCFQHQQLGENLTVVEVPVLWVFKLCPIKPVWYCKEVVFVGPIAGEPQNKGMLDVFDNFGQTYFLLTLRSSFPETVSYFCLESCIYSVFFLPILWQ